MEIAVLGLNHRTAPVELRERIAFGQSQVPAALQALRQEVGTQECVILSTCNRVELYAVLPEVNGQRSRLEQFLVDFHRLNPGILSDRLYWYLAPDSIRHLFKVASGLDSMVVGESEILGQVREAYAQAVATRSVGPVFHRLFQTALRTGKEVRSRTRIGQGATSVSSVAVELARRIFRNLSSKTILVLGAGQMAEGTLASLKERGIRSVLVANRTQEAAAPLAERFGGQAVSLSSLDQALTETDIVICSTSAGEYLIRASDVQRAMAARRQRPLFLIDISVPRNLEPAIGRLENVYLYDIDDLQAIASANLQVRLAEMDACSRIVESELEEFMTRWSLHPDDDRFVRWSAHAARGA